MRFHGALLALPLLLAGCGIPPVIQVASLVVDGVSYAITGKSTTDHALSAVVDEDCALLRAARGDDICEAQTAGEVQMVAADALDASLVEPVSVDPAPNRPEVLLASASDPLAAPTSEPIIDPAAATLVETQLAARTLDGTGEAAARGAPDAVAATKVRAERGRFGDAKPVVKPRSAPTEEPHTVTVLAGIADSETYAVVGSFRRIENARRVARKHDELATIQAIRVDGTVYYRVLIDQPVEQARANGFPDAWPVQMCSNEGGRAPCSHFVVSSVGTYLETAANW